MSAREASSSQFERLRQQAEALVRQQGNRAARPSPTDILGLIHELRIHQTELEIQNEELRRAQEEIFRLHKEYEELYEFAPCGYVTLDVRGMITRANLTAVRILATPRRHLVHSGFSFYIAHEFNNLLTIIMGNNELVMDEVPHGGTIRERVEEIHAAGMRARDVVRQLLTFSRHTGMEQQAIDLGPLTLESMKLIRSSIPTTIQIRQKIPEAVDPIIGNATQINQLLINLCGNAKDAISGDAGFISVSIENRVPDAADRQAHPTLTPGRFVRLTVNDNSCGMDSDTRNRIFEPFFTTKAVGKGTGIGLAAVHGIVKQHRAAIFVDSTPGVGAEFSIWFPAYDEGIDETQKAPARLPPGDERILLVEDEPSILNLGKKQLERLSYTVRTTADPQEALALLQSDPAAFDLIVTDMAMPHMSGDHLSMEALKIRPDIPIILCTGYSERLTEQSAIAIGIRKIATKPVGYANFALLVRKVLDEPKGSAES